MTAKLTDTDENFVCVHDDLMCSFSETTGSLRVWIASRSALPLETDPLSGADAFQDQQSLFSADIESALDALDESTHFNALKPSKRDSVPGLLSTDSFLAPDGAGRDDRFISAHTRDQTPSGGGSYLANRSSAGAQFQQSPAYTSPATATALSAFLMLSGGSAANRSGQDSFSRHGAQADSSDNRRVSGSFGGVHAPCGPIQKDQCLRPYQLASKPTTLLGGAGFQHSKRSSFNRDSPSTSASRPVNHSVLAAAHSPVSKMELSLNSSADITDAASRRGGLGRMSLDGSTMGGPDRAPLQRSTSVVVQAQRYELHLVHLLRLVADHHRPLLV